MSRSYMVGIQLDSTRVILEGHNVIGQVIPFANRRYVLFAGYLLPAQHAEGWTFDLDLLQILEQEGIGTIMIDDGGKGVLYLSSPYDVTNQGIPVCDEDETPQYCLPFTSWVTLDR